MIYCVEDDASIRELVVYTLKATGFEAQGFADGKAFSAALARQLPELVLLDIMLPGEDGLQILKRLRAQAATAAIPVMMLTAKGTEFDKVVGLDNGADDYMTKPFAPEELLARLRALTRRQGDVVADTLEYSDLVLNLSTHCLGYGGREVRLGYKEFEVLRLLLARPNLILPKEELLVKVWGTESDAEDNNVEAYISFLRKKLHFLGAKVTIRSARKVGYYLEVEET